MMIQSTLSQTQDLNKSEIKIIYFVKTILHIYFRFCLHSLQ